MKRTSVSCTDTNRLIRFAHNYMRVHNDRRTLGQVFEEREPMPKIRYDIVKCQSARGRWKWVWVAKVKGPYATIDQAIEAAKAKNKEEGGER